MTRRIDASNSKNEVPVGYEQRPARYGSDVVAQTLRDLGLPYVALNPGASFRGLHDSLVNYLGNETPQILLCLHEEHAVAIAHGYAKVTGRAMAVALHANVGLMHGAMAIFNAWCDRMPVVVLGATGPVDSAKRRPWIDWIHTARDQGALVRHYTKWDDQPGSPTAAREAIVRAAWVAQNAPMGPVYVNLDAGMQEAALESAELPLIDVKRYAPAVRPSAGASEVGRLCDLIAASRRPLLLAGRVSRSEESWRERVELAERLGACVLTDIKVGAAFPTDHPLHAAAPAASLLPDARKLLSEADLVISLDWVDLGGTLTTAQIAAETKIVNISLDHNIHNGWSMDYQALPPVDLLLAADPDTVVTDLLPRLPQEARAPWHSTRHAADAKGGRADERLYGYDLALSLRDAVGARPYSLLHVPISWQGEWWPFRHPLDYIGSDSGGGIGGGPGIAVGAALALQGSARLPIGICGDGDFVMGATSIWTAVRYGTPLLIVIANNASFYNDELHQERVAIARGRPVENKWIGQKMIDPELDLAAMARAQGAQGFGPIKARGELRDVFLQAIAVVEHGGVAVVDVRIEPGYPPDAASAVLHAAEDRNMPGR